MHFIFDAPMVLHEVQEVLGRGLLG
jgi:hypothetical protein